jgi:hypothetical protein
MSFNSTGPHYCPECKPVFRVPKNKPRVRVGVRLELVESNYSGLSVDMATCPECGRGYSISYKVDRIERAPSWDVSPEGGEFRDQ